MVTEIESNSTLQISLSFRVYTLPQHLTLFAISFLYGHKLYTHTHTHKVIIQYKTYSYLYIPKIYTFIYVVFGTCAYVVRVYLMNKTRPCVLHSCGNNCEIIIRMIFCKMFMYVYVCVTIYITHRRSIL